MFIWPLKLKCLICQLCKNTCISDDSVKLFEITSHLYNLLPGKIWFLHNYCFKEAAKPFVKNIFKKISQFWSKCFLFFVDNNLDLQFNCLHVFAIFSRLAWWHWPATIQGFLQWGFSWWPYVKLSHICKFSRFFSWRDGFIASWCDTEPYLNSDWAGGEQFHYYWC